MSDGYYTALPTHHCVKSSHSYQEDLFFCMNENQVADAGQGKRLIAQGKHLKEAIVLLVCTYMPHLAKFCLQLEKLYKLSY